METMRFLLEKAERDKFLSTHEWESLFSTAVSGIQPGEDAERNPLSVLVLLVEAGEITVEGLSRAEVLRRLSVFA